MDFDFMALCSTFCNINHKYILFYSLSNVRIANYLHEMIFFYSIDYFVNFKQNLFENFFLVRFFCFKNSDLHSFSHQRERERKKLSQILQTINIKKFFLYYIYHKNTKKNDKEFS